MALITAYWGLDGMIFLMVLMITAYFYMTRNFTYWKKRGILQITPTPFFGNFKECLFLKKGPAYFLKELYEEKKGAPYVGFFVLDKPFLLVRNRVIVEDILVKAFNYFPDRYSMADPYDRIGYANLFFMKDLTWKAIRLKLTPFFTCAKIKRMFHLMLVCIENLDEHLESLELEGNGKTIEVWDLTTKIATDIIGSTAYGLDVNSFKNPDAEFCKYARMMFHSNTYRGLKMLAIFFFPTIVRLARVKMFGKEPTDFLRKIFWEILTQRMESGLRRNDLIDILIEIILLKSNNDLNLKGFTREEQETRQREMNKERKRRLEQSTWEYKKWLGKFKYKPKVGMQRLLAFDNNDLLSQAASFFQSGFKPFSTTTPLALYELAVQPEIQNTLRKEILNALEESNGEITYKVVWPLPYLDMVISETLRMYPPLGFLSRVATETYKTPGFHLVIEKGTPVYISMLGLHYNPKYFPNPSKFDPERFNEENKRNRPSCVYFPLGVGLHKCVGHRLALLQVKLTLLKILSKYEVTPCEKTSIPLEIDRRAAMTMPLNGIYLNFRKLSRCY